MVGVKTTGVARHLADSFVAVSSASEGVFFYYKFGRHESIFSEKPYFLLSHCAHVLFTLWRFEEEQGGVLLPGQPRPTAFLSGLDFGSLRYNDYKRRMLHADSFEDHWRNETQWFEFWIQILEHYDPSSVAIFREFSRCILACVTQGDVLERKATHRTHTAFDRFMKTDAAGSVMLRTLSILDEAMRGIVQCLAGLDPKTGVVERIPVLAALLNETRRIVIHQTPAKGPYTPLGATRWRAPSPLGRLFWGRTQGILTVVPRREGGDIICTYDPPPQPKNRKRSWTRAASSLSGTYEQELFATWPYESGECRDDPGHPSDVIARWTLQNEEAGRLEAIARRIDALLDGLACSRPCERLVAEVRSVSRNEHARWKAADLPWTYIHRLDELLGKLRFIHREANLLGGNGAADEIIARVWAIPQAQTGETASHDCHEGEDRIACREVPSEVQPASDKAELSIQAKLPGEDHVSTQKEPEPKEDTVETAQGTAGASSIVTPVASAGWPAPRTEVGEVQPVAEEPSSLNPVAPIEPAGADAADASAVVEPQQTSEPSASEMPASAWCAQRLPTERIHLVRKSPRVSKTVIKTPSAPGTSSLLKLPREPNPDTSAGPASEIERANKTTRSRGRSCTPRKPRKPKATAEASGTADHLTRPSSPDGGAALGVRRTHVASTASE